jgi:shikimate dehydrogenase
MFKIFRKKIYGLLGYPAKHSLSPVMHNAAFKALRINAEYKLFEVTPADLDNFLKDLGKNDIFGLNVTIPYKERMMDFATIDFELFHLKRIGAINTIVDKNGVWKGFNTDIAGFDNHLKERFSPQNKKAAIVGAGGAARAVAYVLASSGAKEIAIFDIERAKSENVVKMIRSLFDVYMFSVDKVEGLNIQDKDLLVNATPLGLKETDLLPVKEELLHRGLFVYDLIYNPCETKLLSAAKKIGASCVNGLGMLLYQGMLSFEIWTGKKAPRDVMQNALTQAIENS